MDYIRESRNDDEIDYGGDCYEFPDIEDDNDRKYSGLCSDD